MNPLPPLAEIRALAQKREWRSLADHLSALPEDVLLEAGELAFLYADACWRVGEPERAVEVASRLERRARRLGDRVLVLNVQNVIGMALFELGRTQEAEDRFAMLLEYAVAWRNEEFAARAANNLGVLANVRGRKEEALSCYQRALAAYQRLGYARGLAQTHHNLGIAYHHLGFLQEAEAHCRTAIDLAADAESQDVIALAQVEIASIRVEAGDGRLAETLAQRALQLYEGLRDPLGRADALRVLAGAARARREFDLATERLESALAIAEEHTELHLLGEIHRDRAQLLRERGDAAGARSAYSVAADYFMRFGAQTEAWEMERRARDLLESERSTTS